jgi:tRNA (guanine37-N1)-methyltransferase
MITFDVISIMPQMFDVIKSDGVVSRALRDSKVNLNLWNPRDYVNDVHHTIDDRPYGGGPGMVMMIEPLVKTIRDIKKNHETKKVHNSKVIYLSPKGKRLDQKKLIELSKIDNMILISGRYEGVDQRVIDHFVDEEISIGDFVTTGGELPAMVLIDSLSRLIPGVLNNNESFEDDSFYKGLLDHPQFTRPEVFENLKVPDVLLSGDHNLISKWRKKTALLETFKKRPDLLKDQELTIEESGLLQEALDEQEQDLKKRK